MGNANGVCEHGQYTAHAEFRGDIRRSGELFGDRGTLLYHYDNTLQHKRHKTLRRSSWKLKISDMYDWTSLTLESTGNRPPNAPTILQSLQPLHDLPHPPIDQHPRLQAPPLRSPSALLRLRGLPGPSRARVCASLHPAFTR